MATEEEYKQFCDAIIADMRADTDKYDEYVFAAKLLEGHPENERVFAEAKRLKLTTRAKVEAAFDKLRRRKAQEEKQRNKQRDEADKARKSEEKARKSEEKARQCEDWKQRLARATGASSTDEVDTERKFLSAVIETQSTAMSYGCVFGMRDGPDLTKSELIEKIQLDAADLHIFLQDRNFPRAMNEYCREQRAARREAIWQVIASLSDSRTADAVNHAAGRLFQHVFKDGPFAEAAVRSAIWAVKRKMRHMAIPEAHCFIFHGPQDSGKTFFWGYLETAVADLCKHVTVEDITDTRQLDIFRYSILNCDELSKASKADLANFKSAVTQNFMSRRKYYTQELEDVPMSAVIIGTTNFPLSEVFQDTSGMRRFVQIDIKPRQLVQNWKTEVEEFDWLGLWQVVNHEAEDPLTPFMRRLRQDQEDMRVRDRVEQFLEEFDAFWVLAKHQKHLSKQDGFYKSEPPHRLVFNATGLFALFKEFEEFACPGQKMHLGTFGRKVKALCDPLERKFPEWSYQTYGTRSWYIRKTGEVLPLSA